MKTKNRWLSLIIGGGGFGYLLLRVDPKLIYQAQEPAFLLDGHFAARFLCQPGGVNDLAARFLSQWFYFSWTGALLLTLVLGLMAWITRHVLRSMGMREPIVYVHWVPSILGLALHSHYRFPLVLTLGLVWAFAAAWVFVRRAPSSTAMRYLVFALVQTLLYTIAAGQAFVFAAAVVTYEVLCLHRLAGPLGYAVFSLALPYAVASTVWAMPVQDAYTLHLISFGNYTGTWLLWSLYAFLPVSVAALAVRSRAWPSVPSRKGRAGLWDRLTVARTATTVWLQGVLMLCAAATAAWHSYDREGKAFLEMDYYSQYRQWDKVIASARQGMAGSAYGLCQVNRALYHKGLLCERLFSFPQVAGSSGLFLPRGLAEILPLRQSDVFFDLGLVNEAQHWAHEAISVTGESAWNLQRLLLVNAVKGDRVVAEKYLAMLRQTLWHRSWARVWEDRVFTEGVSTTTELEQVRARMPVSDFLVSPAEPQRCLGEMVKNTTNKMAFEYFMASCLLEGDLSGFVAHLDRLPRLGYARIPRHFEEALLIYMQLTGRSDIPLPTPGISQQTREEFKDFNQILVRHRGDKNAARQELAKYKDTYWFYGQYYYKPKES